MSIVTETCLVRVLTQSKWSFDQCIFLSYPFAPSLWLTDSLSWPHWSDCIPPVKCQLQYTLGEGSHATAAHELWSCLFAKDIVFGLHMMHLAFNRNYYTAIWNSHIFTQVILLALILNLELLALYHETVFLTTDHGVLPGVCLIRFSCSHFGPTYTVTFIKTQMERQNKREIKWKSEIKRRREREWMREG